MTERRRRKSYWSAFRGADGALFGALLVLLLWAPIPLGSARPWAVSLLAVMALLIASVWLLLLVLGKCRSNSLELTHWVIAAAGIAWLLWTGFHWLPMDGETLKNLSPLLHSYYAAANEYLARPATFRLSLDAGSSYRQWLLTAGLLAYGVTVWGCVNTRQRQRILMWSIVLLGFTQALVGACLELSNMEPQWFGSVINGPLGASGTYVNRNHFAGCLEISLAVGIGLLVSRLSTNTATNWRQRLRAFIDLLMSEKIRLRLILIAMVVGLILSRSRMGNVAFFSALIGCGLFYILVRERRLFLKSVLLFGSILLIDLMVVGQWYGVDKVVDRLEKTDAGSEMRVVIFPDLNRIAQDSNQVGIGLGAFYAIFPDYRTDLVWQRFHHAHNDYLQFYIETGLPGIVLLALMIGGVVLYAIRLIINRRDRLACGIGLACFMAFTAIGIHSLVDFNLQIPANAFLLCAVAALALGCSQVSRSEQLAARREREKQQQVSAEPEST